MENVNVENNSSDKETGGMYMTYKKNVSNMVIAIVCVILSAITAFYCVPRFSLLSSDAVSATVVSADTHGTSGYAVLKVDGAREDGGTIFFHYYYPGNKSHLKPDESVLVSGNIKFMDESTKQGVNADLVIGTRMPVLICSILSLLGVVGAICLLSSAIRNFRNKPWSSDEEIDTRNKLVNAFYTAEILALVVALIFFVAGMTQVVGYVCKKNHTTGNVTYQNSRQSSQYVKVHSGNGVRNYKSNYGKGIRPTYTVLQIKANSPVNGADVFWYEGNCFILGSKNVYIGYNDNSMSVVSQFELVMTIISGMFLLVHAVSAMLISKKNPYGGKIFWFFKF